MKNKRGFQLAVETAIVMVLAVVLLVTLFGFWAYQRGIFRDFLRGKDEKPNVDEVVGVCNGLAEREAEYEYCCDKKNIKYLEDDEVVEVELSCDEFADVDFSGGRVSKLNCEGVC